MTEKVLNKIETKDPEMRKEIEQILRNNNYEICPYVIRIYDFINIMDRGKNGGNGKNIGVQCIYRGTIHNPDELCLGKFVDCKKHRELKKHEELMKT